VSDDHHYVIDNAFVRELSFENAVRILDPTSDAALSISNYAPVQLLLHSVALRSFGADTTGHHVLNVALHALASVLLVALFLQSGLPRAAALLGGALFLAHPANVEAVAWISQLKSSASLVLALASLLAYARRPGFATVGFALALLAKGHAAIALPAAALFEWLRTGRVRWRWMALWAALFAAYAVVEIVSHERNQGGAPPRDDTPAVWLLTAVAIAMRYLVMAATSWGVSAFHEIESVRSPLDPWFLAGLVALPLLSWRWVVVLKRRSEEAVYWLWALIAFAPVSQLFPFLYPMADRYLYFMLPGLIGGALFAACELGQRVPQHRRRAAGIAAALMVAALAVFFAARSAERAAIWRSATSLVADAATHYPEGVSANLLRAKRAAQFGDVAEVVAALRAAARRGYTLFEPLENDPAFAGLRQHPEFRAVISEIAEGWIVRGRAREDPTQQELQMIGHAHFARGEKAEAIAALRRALAKGGPRDGQIRADLAALGAPEP
jgi:protein O-mannosyl-transferase